MRSELIISKNPKALIADDYIQEAIKTHPTALGYAVVKDGIVENGHWAFDDMDLLSALMKTQETYKDQRVFFHLMNLDDKDMETTSEVSMQPFPILTKKNKEGKEECVLAAMLDGDFLTYVDKNEETPAYNLVSDYLAEKVRSAYKRNAQDIVKTCEELDSPPIRKDLLPHLHPRGVITIIPVGHTPFRYERNDLSGEYSWGYASKKLGIEPVAATAITKTDNKPLTMAERKKLKTSPPTIIPEKKEEPTVTEPAVSHESVIKRTIDGKEVIWVKPPKGGIGETKNFWNRHTTLAKPPADKPLLLYEGFPAASLKAQSTFVPFAEKLGAVITTRVEQSAFRDKMKKAEEDKTKRAEAQLDKDMSGLMTVDDKQAVVAMNKDVSAGYFLTPAEMEVHLKDTPAYSKQVSVPFEKLVTASKKFWFKQEKRALVNALAEFSTFILAHGLLDKKIEAAITAEKKEETPPKKTSFAARKAAGKAA